MNVEFHGIAIEVNPGIFHGVAIDQNPMVFQGIAVDQNPAVFQGITVDQNPVLFKGITIDQNPTLFKGIAIQQGELVPIVPEPGCPGEIVESYLAIHQGQSGQFLSAYNDDFTPFFQLRISQHTSESLMELLLGSKEAAGALRIAGPECRNAICIDGIEAAIVVGCEFSNGKVVVRNARNDDLIKVDGVTGSIHVGGTQVNGDLRVFSPYGSVAGPSTEASLHFSADTGNLSLNGNGIDGGRLLLRKNGQAAILVNGDTGEIELANADFAEEFPLTDSPAIAGMVMITDPNGALSPCDSAYDTRVTGVLSGAGAFRPAIVLDKQRNSRNRRLPVAMVGKTYCFVDASETAIEPGDLLTTSPTPGHAMKALDIERAFGACLGKALEACPKGEKRLIPIRVSLI